MTGTPRTHHGEVAVHEVPPMRDLSFSMLSILIETAAGHLRVDMPQAAESKPVEHNGAPNMDEARAAIDAANALLASVRTVMESDALLAIEGLLTQLQIQYVQMVSRRS